MIIDAHCHIKDFDWYPEKWWLGLARSIAPRVKIELGIKLTPQQIIDKILSTMMDPSGEMLIREMDRAGIDKTVILIQDFGLALGEPKTSIEEQNQIYADIQNKYPKRILAFAGVDPRRPNAKELIKRCFEEWNMSGLKFNSSSGFYPNSQEVYNLLDIAMEYEKPVLFHTGEMVTPLRSKFCDPIFLDDVCLDYPDLWIQAAHMGYGWRNNLFHLGSSKPNLTVDIAGWQGIARDNYLEFCSTLRLCLDEFTAERVLFGTDNPYFRAILPDKKFVNLIKRLPERAPEGIKFTQEEVNLILGENARRIFGINE